MKNITKEQIDTIINKAFIEQNKNMLRDYSSNYEAYKKACDEAIKHNEENVPLEYLERFASDFSDAFASFKLAQDNCVEILRKTLQELLCD